MTLPDPSGTASPLAQVRAALKRGDDAAAKTLMADIVRERFGLNAETISFNADGYSLNSANGFIRLGDGQEFFFKFHQEEGEESTVGEYYQASLLEQAGFPVDVPMHVSTEPGQQLVLYRRRDWQRLADAALEVERAGCPDDQVSQLAEAEAGLSQAVMNAYRRTLHEAQIDQLRAEPVLQLFTWRLVDEEGDAAMGGRARSFYEGQMFDLPGLDQPVAWEELRDLRWTINDTPYPLSLAEAFDMARRWLQPRAVLAERAVYGAVTGHGDAHNANVWLVPGDGRGLSPGPSLSLFDPAFAGAHLPLLLAEVKPTFHNIFAHPDWLYHPQAAGQWLDVTALIEGNRLIMQHNWALSPLRREFLRVKVEEVWVPLLKMLAHQKLLPDHWRTILRAALFACPTLVMSLVPGAGSHVPQTALMGLGLAVMLASDPADGTRDCVTDFLDPLEAAANPARRYG